MNVCPVDAICMNYNAEGFIAPHIDGEKCINCGLCKKTCPSNTQLSFDIDEFCKSFAMYNTDDTITGRSSSGGVFYACAAHVIERYQGVVFGAIYDERKQVKIVPVTETSNLDAMMGSKYVYSRTDYTYRMVKEYLEQDKMVLYSGLPCQISGLLNYLKKPYKKLITVEILCHGAPSQKLFDKYINAMEEKYGLTIKSINQRYGDRDWNPLIQKRIYIEFENGKKIITREDNDVYMSLFIRELSYGNACYECLYANEKRRADITLGDYGGLGITQKYENINPKGVSFVRVNSMKAYKFLNELNDIYMEERPDDEIMLMNSAIVRPTRLPASRDMFLRDSQKLTSEALFEKYYYKDYSYRIRCVIKNLIIKMVGAERVARVMCNRRKERKV